MKTEYVNPHHFILEIEASGGTYIKEFVHGDLGRTRPNVGEILVDYGISDECRISIVISFSWM